ncbi:hypothetical protein ONE63_007636 [Megalurothrips usitatus]|uniref:Innexin n=1 Tax=Megalurothrips usitatus TaxID=439358 RepID=A0AAV7XNB8_9NEOP|nr:hypothetical protein ONE63_007636 [Megalurothrips usitatus]
MFKLFGGLKEYFKLPDVIIDSPIFRLHNLFTTALLASCSLVITATQYVGKPIECIVNGLPTHPINTYCWITSTFTMPDAFQRQVGKEVAHPGVANDFGDEDAKKYYTYYQWVCFVLFFQVSFPPPAPCGCGVRARGAVGHGESGVSLARAVAGGGGGGCTS